LHSHGIDGGKILGGDLLVDKVQGGEGPEEGGEVNKDGTIPKVGILFKEHGGNGVGKQRGVKDSALGVGEMGGTDRHLASVGHDGFTERDEG
jgi:hypothetical protein